MIVIPIVATVPGNILAYPLVAVLCVGLAALLDRVPRRVGLMIVICWALVNTALSRERVEAWRDDLTLFRSTVSASPRSAKAHRGLAQALQERGRLVEAVEAYDRALEFHERSRALHAVSEDRRGMALALTSIGALHALREAPEYARESLERARKLFADLGDTAAEAGALC